MESTYGDLLNKSSKPKPSNPSLTDQISRKLQETYKKSELIDLTEEDPLHNIIYNLNPILPKRPEPPPQPRQITLDTILKNSAVPTVSILSLNEKQKQRVLPDTFKKKNYFKEDTEEKALKNFKQWKDSLGFTNLPKKREQSEDTPDILKRSKKSVQEQNVELLKAHNHPTFDANKFVEMQQKEKLEEKKREEAHKKAREKNLEQKKYEQSMKNCQFNPEAARFTDEEILAQEKARRKNLMDITQEFIGCLLNLELFSNESSSCDYKISASFKHGGEYINSFMPAFFEEVRAEIISALNQNNMSIFWKINIGISSTSNGKDYLEFEDSDLNNKFSTNVHTDDLILLIGPCESQLTSYNPIFSKWEKISNYTLAFVEKDQKTNRIIFKTLPEKLDSLFSNSNLNDRISMNVFIIDSCTTLFREFKMIRMSEFLELSDYIYTPKKAPLINISDNYADISKCIRKYYNPSQTEAIMEACRTVKGIYLLQGPPGTGKTRTIRGIISAINMKDKENSKILVCAPSNSAIDEIANRVLTEKILDFNSFDSNIEMVRIVSNKASVFDIREAKKQNEREMPKAVKDICLDELVSVRMDAPELMNELIDAKSIKKKLDKIDNLIKIYENDPEKTEQLSEVKRKKFEITQIHYKKKAENKNVLEKIRNLEESIVKNAKIVFCTLSGAAGKELAYKGIKFDYIIVDEACQSVELSTLIPFRFNSKIAILVGDPKQLPATTFSTVSTRNNYSRSLFERLMDGGCRVKMLEIQYRMLPEICQFSSSYFYNSQLITDKSIHNKICPDWIKTRGMLFINLLNSKESRNIAETSVSNTCECEFIGKIFSHFKHIHGRSLNIGIITPYKKQVVIIKQYLQNFYKDSWKRDVEVNTIDGFQGKEKDVIIFSAVRTGNTIGFLADQRRINVAITRAKYALWIVGSKTCLSKNQCWGQLINYIESQNRLLNCNNFNEITDYFTSDFAQPVYNNANITRELEQKETEPYIEKIEKKTVYKETVNMQTVYKEAVNKQTVYKETVNKQTINKETVNKQTKPKESAKEVDNSKLFLDILSRGK